MVRNENNLMRIMVKEKIMKTIRTFEEAGYPGFCRTL